MPEKLDAPRPALSGPVGELGRPLVALRHHDDGEAGRLLFQHGGLHGGLIYPITPGLMPAAGAGRTATLPSMGRGELVHAKACSV
jgi:hypothetical protein